MEYAGEKRLMFDKQMGEVYDQSSIISLIAHPYINVEWLGHT